MLRRWQLWVLLALLVGPILAYIGMGFLWLRTLRGPLGITGEWAYYATTAWIGSGAAFAILLNRWTRGRSPLLPPIDWDAPRTFTEHDRRAWRLVEDEAERSNAITLENLTKFDTYVETGRNLAKRLAAHYQPLSTDPVEHVPVIEILTAAQLAAEDLAWLCREVPGGDMVTPAHWKKAVVAANYLSKANDLYTVLLPLFQPVTGLGRLVTQKWMVQPAWKNMQQNLMRWFFRAYVNRLGTHLIELYSGRLAIGADQYRRLTRRGRAALEPPEADPPSLIVAVAGARDSGKSRLIEALDRARDGSLETVRARLAEAGFEEGLADLLRTSQVVEVAGYTTSAVTETARDRSTRREAAEQAVEADLLLLVSSIDRDDLEPDAKFLKEWSARLARMPGREAPPAVAVLTGADRPSLGDSWRPPYDWERGHRPREEAVRARLECLRAALSPEVTDVVAVGLVEDPPFGVSERLLPEVAALLHRAERSALIRVMHRASTRSKARRLVGQIGRQSRRLWGSVRPHRRDESGAS